MTPESGKPPGITGRLFYSILYRADGLADIFLDPRVYPATDEEGRTDYDISFRVARNIDTSCYGDLEANIRENYADWCEIAEVVWM